MKNIADNELTVGPIAYRETNNVPKDDVLSLYRATEWSSAEKPDQLHQALLNSDALVSAWDGERLVGLANAISDALEPMGIEIDELPVTPDRLYKLIYG